MYFRVFDEQGKDITSERCWIITSNGKLCYLDYESVVGMPGTRAVLYFNNGDTEEVIYEG